MPLALSLTNLYSVYSSTNTISLILLSAILLLVILVARTNMPVVLKARKKSVGDGSLLPTRDDDSTLSQEATPPTVQKLPSAPGPRPWPLFGSLHLLAKGPWDAFVRLREIYGDVFNITLGSRKCVVISSIEAIREVLITKGDSFSGRPNFVRYHALFGGNRDRSLALCDWSSIQKLRRKVAMPYVFPRNNSSNFNQLEDCIDSELQYHLESLSAECLRSAGVAPSRNEALFDKARFSLVCANIFFRYFCSKSYEYTDKYFQEMVNRFDYIFSDINNGSALDMLPWLRPFYRKHLSRLSGYGQFIRRFLIDTLIKDRMPEEGHPLGCEDGRPRDFLDNILQRTLMNMDDSKKHLTSDYALYELEDILGGHTAVACFFTRVLAQVITRPDVQQKVQEEIDAVLAGDSSVRLCHRNYMTYTQAVILEVLRVTTSPIVPHVASEDSSILGFGVEKGTMIMINNYYLNTSDVYWESPELFNPSRFINEQGQLFKPDYFMPFGAGKRSCLGYELLKSITFMSLVRILQHYDIFPTEEDAAKLRNGSTAVFNVERAKLSVNENSVRAIYRPRGSATREIAETESKILV